MNETIKEQEKIKERENEQQPNITFGIDGKIISNIFGFVTGINSEIPMKFEKDRIFIHLKSPDNIQYAHVEILASELVDYKPRLEYGNTEKNIVINTRNVNLEKIDEINNVTQPDNIHTDDDMLLRNTGDRLRGRNVEVKVFEKLIEFHLPGSVIVWTDLIIKDVEKTMKGIERLPELIKKARSDSTIKKGTVLLRPIWLSKICDTKVVYNYESTFRLNISKEGFDLISKSKDDFYELKLKPVCLRVEPNGDEETRVYINKEFITPITKIKCSDLVLIEIRNDKPVIFETKLSKNITAMLTVAPRLAKDMEDEDAIHEEYIKKMQKMEMQELDF
jgi:hypothetical protein